MRSDSSCSPNLSGSLRQKKDGFLREVSESYVGRGTAMFNKTFSGLAAARIYGSLWENISRCDFRTRRNFSWAKEKFVKKSLYRVYLFQRYIKILVASIVTNSADWNHILQIGFKRAATHTEYWVHSPYMSIQADSSHSSIPAPSELDTFILPVEYIHRLFSQTHIPASP